MGYQSNFGDQDGFRGFILGFLLFLVSQYIVVWYDQIFIGEFIITLSIMVGLKEGKHIWLLLLYPN